MVFKNWTYENYKLLMEEELLAFWSKVQNIYGKIEKQLVLFLLVKLLAQLPSLVSKSIV